MSNRKLAKAIQQLFREIWKLYHSLSKGFVTWLLRAAFLPNRRRLAAGFVLPTTVLLVLVVTLTASALSYRALNSSSRVIGNVQSKAIYNSATPAVDRARAKLDYMFGKDPRLPGGVPAEGFMISMMLNDGRAINGTSAQQLSVTLPGSKPNDPYTLTDEDRVDVNQDGNLDNAWIYTEPNSGNKIIYAVNMATPNTSALLAYDLLKMTEAQKATGTDGGPYVRTGPLSNNKAQGCPGAGGRIETGWYEDPVDTAILRKRFQVQALVANPADAAKNKTNFATLEFSQDRQLDRGNKWGAWFRYDLEIHPGSAMNWNGAMHSEGSIIIGNSSFNSFLISSPASCVFLPVSNSEVSVPTFPDGQPADATAKFEGVIASGTVGNNTYGGNTGMHVYQGNSYDASPRLNTGTDWATEAKTLAATISDPLKIITDDLRQARETDINNLGAIIASPDADPTFGQNGTKRFKVEDNSTPPYLDDLYRADNRWGPKVQYKSDRIPTGTNVGDPITGKDELTRDGGGGADPGLDGYWERRTFAGTALDDKVYTGGMRVIVGERLELGNPFGWVAPQNRPDNQKQKPEDNPPDPTNLDGSFDDLRKGDYTALTNANTDLPNADWTTSDNPGDPLNPPYGYADPTRTHEARHRRALRDNLAAVQATAVYHYRINDGKFPAACIINTSHPGTPTTLAQSVDFTQPTNNNFGGKTYDLRFNFFTGKGTNGWEFQMPQANFEGAAMQQALQNLAYFAGDYNISTGEGGAFPPTQKAGEIHPDPALTMFGNFSNLRRALATPSASRSPADWSYMHTAGCTLGALGYNINQIQQFNPSDQALANDLATLAARLGNLMDGNLEGTNPEVLPKSLLATYGYSGTGVYDATQFNPRDYDNVTPDMMLAALKQKLGGDQIEQIPNNYRLYRLAELIHESYQIRRDRTYGFRPSPAANTWNYNPYMTLQSYNQGGTNYKKINLWSSACDPYMFSVPSDPTYSTSKAASASITDPKQNQRLLLSRLCGAVIPPGGVHDQFNADYSYPARKGTAAEKRDYLPKTDNDTVADGMVSNLPPGVATPAAYTTASTLNTGSDPDGIPYRDDKYLYATVAPKFPTLYYIFPEFSHDQTGGNDANGDHRQPGSLTPVAAFRPWNEPYLTKPDNGQALSQTVNSGLQYSAVTTTQNLPALPDYGSGVAITGVPFTVSPTLQVTGFTYKAVQVFKDDLSTDLGVTPQAAITGWTLPNVATVTVPNNADTANPNLIRYGNPDPNSSTIGAVPFLDRVLFDGRQWLPNRVLDIDLNMLRSASPSGNTDENWLPVSGIVYAFREDARREDAIARPANAKGYTDLSDLVTPNAQTDPGLAKFNISQKAIDYMPDPDRRDHGFRLRNGASLKRKATGIPSDKNVRGLTFVSDNSAYILGNFNLHNTADDGAGTRLEEFTVLLPNTDSYGPTEFYDNRTKPTLDTNFADRDKDFWRPSEILADSVTILTKTFCDGSVIDTFSTAGKGSGQRTWAFPITGPTSGTDMTNVYRRFDTLVQGASVYNDQRRALFGPGCDSGAPNGSSTKVTSFLNQNRPSDDLRTDQTSSDATNWLRENPNDPLSPVKLSRNGNGLLITNANANTNPPPFKVPVEYSSGNDPVQGHTTNGYMTELDGDGYNDQSRPLQTPYGTSGTENVTNVNAILISGIIPSRSLQTYGGMHNFPRLLEYWQGTPLRMAGSFLQLNFSNYATGPYDQEVWEPGNYTPTSGDDMIDYYGYAPQRLWGYDVALKLAPASPAASRFTQPSTQRNEFYEEPKVNDPYIQKMCTTLKNAANGVPALNCPT